MHDAPICALTVTVVLANPEGVAANAPVVMLMAANAATSHNIFFKDDHHSFD
jgi:hypothetical protein